MRRRGVRLLIGRAALALLVPAFVVELLLQIAAFWVANAAPRAIVVPAAASSRTVLCVGDSYTFGIGASDADHAYPARLAGALEERDGEAWSVQNGGWPGRNSRDVLRELPEQLDRFAPGWVCILVGTNDGWSRPDGALRESWFEEAAGTGFRLEWRTPRLAALVWNGWRERRRVSAFAPPDALAAERAAAPSDRAPALIGSWQIDGRIARFDGDGRCYWKERERRFSIDGERLCIVADEAGPEVAATWRVERGRLHLRLRGGAKEGAYPPPRRRRSAVDPQVAAALATGGRAAAQARLAELRAAATESPAAAASCLAAQIAVERGVPSVALARELLVRFPDAVELLAQLAEQAQQIGDEAAALEAVERALALAPAVEPLLRADLHRARALTLRRSEPREALQSISESYRLDGDRARAAAALRAQREAQESGGSGEPRGWADLPAEVVGRLELLERGAPQPGDEASATSSDEAAVGATLESHLRQAIALCRSRGATPVLLSYPFRDRHQARVFAHFSADAALRRVALHVEFEQLLDHCTREELFVADGHCNDAGYAVIATVVADALLR